MTSSPRESLESSKSAIAAILRSLALTEAVNAETRAADTNASIDFLRSQEPDLVPIYVDLKRSIDRHAQRERELSQLFISAQELAESEDRSNTLSRLTARVRELLQCDVSYLSEFNEGTGSLDVLFSSGVFTTQFKRLHVPPGVGLASEIAHTRKPAAAPHYQDYTDRPHDADIDEAISNEGIVSLAGVPLLTEDSVIGVLFVGSRRERLFETYEIAVLSALAHLASLAIQKSDALDRSETAQREALAMTAQLTAQIASRDKANTVHEALIHAALEGGGTQSVIETLAQQIRAHTALFSHTGDLIAVSHLDHDQNGDAITAPQWQKIWSASQTQAAVESSKRSGHCTPFSIGEVENYAIALHASSDLDAALVLLENDFLQTQAGFRAVERAAHVCAMVLLQAHVESTNSQRFRDRLVSDLLEAEDGESESIIRRLASLNIKVQDLTTLSTIVPLHGTGEISFSSARLRQSSVLTGEHNRRIYSFSSNPLESGQLDVRHSNAELSRFQVLTTTIDASSTSRFYEAAERLRRLQRVVTALNISEPSVHFDDFAPYVVAFGDSPESLSSFVSRQLLPLWTREAGAGSPLLKTAAAYFAAGSNASLAAKNLHFHLNTINQRLGRIDSLLGKGWRGGEKALRLSLALQLFELNPEHFSIIINNMQHSQSSQ